MVGVGGSWWAEAHPTQLSYATTTQLLRNYYATTTQLLRNYYATTTQLLRNCRRLAVQLEQEGGAFGFVVGVFACFVAVGSIDGFVEGGVGFV